MGMMQKRKGRLGEQELARLLRDDLGDAVTRNLQQSREGGADLDGTPWMLEVKRAAKPRIEAWWTQACNQAKASTKCPCLAWRIDRGEWRFRIPLGAVHGGFRVDDTSLAIEMDIAAFIAITRKIESQRQLHGN